MKKPNLVSLGTRLNMSPTQQAAHTKALITELGGETSTIAASYATAGRSRSKLQWRFPQLAKSSGTFLNIYTSALGYKAFNSIV